MKKNNKKILFIVSEDWYFISHRLNLAKFAIQNGYQVALLARPSKHFKFLQSNGLTVFNWSLDRQSYNPIKEIYALWQIIKTIKIYSPDIIHAVALKPIIYSSLVSRLTGVNRCVFALGGLGFIFSSDSSLAKMLRLAMIPILKIAFSKKNSRVIVQNLDNLEKLISLNIADKLRLRLIKGAGVDTHIFSPRSKSFGVPLVVLPSRLLWSKGIGDFVNAAINLKAKGIKARFAIVGSRDPHNPECISELQMDQWQKDGNVEIWGYREDMPNVFNNASIVCLPSAYGEGLPKALLEAASCGLPIVTYDTPGCRDIVTNEENGLLVPLKNQLLLENALERLINDSALRKKMGKKGRLKVINLFSQEKINIETLSVWEDLL